jgi:hypothetical protein
VRSISASESLNSIGGHAAKVVGERFELLAVDEQH